MKGFKKLVCMVLVIVMAMGLCVVSVSAAAATINITTSLATVPTYTPTENDSLGGGTNLKLYDSKNKEVTTSSLTAVVQEDVTKVKITITTDPALEAGTYTLSIPQLAASPTYGQSIAIITVPKTGDPTCADGIELTPIGTKFSFATKEGYQDPTTVKVQLPTQEFVMTLDPQGTAEAAFIQQGQYHADATSKVTDVHGTVLFKNTTTSGDEIGASLRDYSILIETGNTGKITDNDAKLTVDFPHDFAFYSAAGDYVILKVGSEKDSSDNDVYYWYAYDCTYTEKGTYDEDTGVWTPDTTTPVERTDGTEKLTDENGDVIKFKADGSEALKINQTDTNKTAVTKSADDADSYIVVRRSLPATTTTYAYTDLSDAMTAKNKGMGDVSVTIEARAYGVEGTGMAQLAASSTFASNSTKPELYLALTDNKDYDPDVNVMAKTTGKNTQGTASVTKTLVKNSMSDYVVTYDKAANSGAGSYKFQLKEGKGREMTYYLTGACNPNGYWEGVNVPAVAVIWTLTPQTEDKAPSVTDFTAATGTGATGGVATVDLGTGNAAASSYTVTRYTTSGNNVTDVTAVADNVTISSDKATLTILKAGYFLVKFNDSANTQYLIYESASTGSNAVAAGTVADVTGKTIAVSSGAVTLTNAT